MRLRVHLLTLVLVVGFCAGFATAATNEPATPAGALTMEQADDILRNHADDPYLTYPATEAKAKLYLDAGNVPQAAAAVEFFQQLYAESTQSSPSGYPYVLYVADTSNRLLRLIAVHEKDWNQAFELTQGRLALFTQPQNELARAELKKNPRVFTVNVLIPFDLAIIARKLDQPQQGARYYADIQAYLNRQRVDPTKLANVGFTQARDYLAPVGLAMCLYEQRDYAGAMAIFTRVAAALDQESVVRDLIVPIPANQNSPDYQKYQTAHAHDAAVVWYFKDVDLPLRIAACLLKQGEKAQAAGYLVRVSATLAQPAAEEALKLVELPRIDRVQDEQMSVQEFLQKMLPALKKAAL